MSEQTYKRLEKTVIIFMLVGLVAMFQPWFSNVASWFDAFAVESNFGRAYSREVAPVIFRYGFYLLLFSTIAFTVLSHYSIEDLEQAVMEKGSALTWLLIALPVVAGYVLLINLASGFSLAAFLGVLAFICAIAIWQWRRWGVIGYGLLSLVWVVLVFMGSAQLASAVFNFILTIVIMVLLWPRRDQIF